MTAEYVREPGGSLRSRAIAVILERIGLKRHNGDSPADTPSDSVLTMEFAYTAWSESCRNLFTIDQCCRRPYNHAGNHASGYGVSRRRWLE
jgi:hypothetical protein